MAYITEFGEKVRALVGDTPYRTLAARSGLSPAYIADMVQGRVPAREKVLAFAAAVEATEDQTDELLIAGKYSSTRPENSGNVADRALEIMAEVQAMAPDRPFVVPPWWLGGIREATLEEVEANGEELKRLRREGKI